MPEPCIPSPIDDGTLKIVKRRGGKEYRVEVDEVWDSLCKILRICRLLTCPGHEEYRDARLAFLAERLTDLEGLEFRYKRHPFGPNIDEEFVPTKR